MDNLIYAGERLDDTGFGDIRLIQRPEDFCYGVDAVILADFTKVKKDDRVMDLGTGTGIIPMILSHKTEAKDIWAVEVQKDSYERALRNVKLNKLEDRVTVIHADVKNLPTVGIFNVVVSNPPYMKSDGGIKNENDAKSIARHETSATLVDFINTAGNLLKTGGDFYLVHRPSRMVDICCACRNAQLEPKEMRLVSPNKNAKPNIVLIHCVKYGRPELRFLEPLYIYDERGKYTSEIMEIYER